MSEIINKVNVLGEIRGFLEGYNNDLKYVVNVETDPATNVAECLVHEPNKKSRIIKAEYEPFMYMKDLSKTKHVLYANKSKELQESMKIKYGITITKLKTGNQKRLVDGYCYKITSSKSYNAITNYLADGGLNPYEKVKDVNDEIVKDKKGKPIYMYGDLFYAPRTTEQFFISNQTRLFKGFEEYKDVHKLTFDIETTGLRYQIARIILIGVRDNRGFETILELDKLNDDESEIKLIQDFFNLINYLQPAIISGYNSEEFDFEFILGRAKLLKMDLSQVPTGLKKDIQLRRRPNTSVKYGNTADKYTATEMWGYSVIDIIHAVKKTQAINSDLKEAKLKYVAKFEKVARPNRTYINGEDNSIGKYYKENKIFLVDENNNYIQIPDEYQIIARKLYTLQANKDNISKDEHLNLRVNYLSESPDFVNWFRTEALPKKLNTFISGKNLVKQYLLDDLWETEQVDELYNQSSFLLAKMIPTTYQRICTMGTAGIWNLLMTAWSYENDLAVPAPDKYKRYSGGLARTYKVGFFERIVKVDYGALYPTIQLTEDVFPIFDITGAMKKMLLYFTTTRNIYKKLANSDELNKEEVMLFKQIDPEAHARYINKELTATNKSMFKIKQLPIKILNNSQYGALGSHVSFNWSDNICAARITCTARLHLRHAISWFGTFGCIPLLAVTDGINFHFPKNTRIKVTNDEAYYEDVNSPEKPIEEMWKYDDKTGIDALIAKYNKELNDDKESLNKKNYVYIDNDGESISCLNLARINYATLALAKDKKTDETHEKIKLTGNTIKSKTMPEYIEEFIDKGFELILHGKGKEFVDYYYDYAENIRYMRIPLKKIANKSKIKNTIGAYKKRGVDKNGREKGMQAHMELLIEKRNEIAEKLFEKHKDELNLTRLKDNLNVDDKMRLIANYMPPEPELDTYVYYVNTGYKKSHGDSRKIKDKNTAEERFCAKLISNEDLQDNPNMTGTYNYEKYLDAFNKRVATLLVGFEPEVAKKILVKITKDGDLKKEMFSSDQLILKSFDLDDFDESMHLEEMEVDFWNSFGYDPRLIWDGFKMFENNKVHYEIYDNALYYLNEKMTASGKPKIKSINSDYKAGDLVLIKNGSEYHVGAYNGTCIQIIRDNIQVPKSEIELELDKRREEQENKIQELETSELSKKTDRDLYLERETKFRETAFVDFKEKHGIPMEWTMEQTFREIENSNNVFEDFVAEKHEDAEDDIDEYIGGDDLESDEY